LVAVTDAISKQAAEVMEAACRNGLRPDDDLALLLAKITDLANAVGNATAEGQNEATLKQLGAAAQKLTDAATVHEEEIGRAMFRAGLTVARQLAVRVERRTAVAIGAVCVLIAVLSGGIGYAVGTRTARLPPISACWQQSGHDVCTAAAWFAGAPR
jgi:hypothetical protein